TDFSGLFDEFFIDLTNIGAGSKEVQDKVELIKHFQGLINGVDGSQQNLEQMVEVRTNAQYVQGL
ncbi:hypothetical protein LMH73_010405, partial [Vibrio splendidus]